MLTCSVFLVRGEANRQEFIAAVCQAQAAPPKPTTVENLSFKLLTIGNKLRDDGIMSEILKIESSKGDLLYKTTIPFKSEDQAKKELFQLLSTATKVERKSIEIDDNGKRIGDRVLARFSTRDESHKSLCLFYTKHSTYYQIESDSLDALLAYEKLLLENSKK